MNTTRLHDNTMSTQLREVDEKALKYLQNNRGEYYSAEVLAAAINYSEGYVRERLHLLADSNSTDVERDRRYKEIYGVVIGNDFVVLTSDKSYLLDVVRQYQPSDLAEARAMTKEELWTFITEDVAAKEVTSKTDMLYFGIPK